MQFNGRALLIASDADMVATAYADGKLDRVAGIEDTLTAIDLPLNQQQPKISALQVSNSVMSWPQIIATSPDSTKAYFVEVRGIRKVAQLEPTALAKPLASPFRR